MISCLRRAGVTVAERHIGVWEHDTNWNFGATTLLRLAVAEARLLRQVDGYEAIIVGYPGPTDVPVARRAARRLPIVFNALVSVADTLVSDRRRFASGSLLARAAERLDRTAFRAADLVVADTHAQAQFFRTLGARNVEVCFVGAEERVFRPGWQPRDDFHALFVGKLIPLQGIETILEAARLAPEIRFRVVGNGQLDSLLDKRPPNVEWVRWVDYRDLPHELHRAGCALGIFGTSAKASRVIPNKVFQALACGTPVITAGTPAARELLTDREDALLVRSGDAEALADAVRVLANDRQLAMQLSTKGLATYGRRASEDVLGRQWRGLLERLVH